MREKIFRSCSGKSSLAAMATCTPVNPLFDLDRRRLIANQRAFIERLIGYSDRPVKLYPVFETQDNGHK